MKISLYLKHDDRACFTLTDKNEVVYESIEYLPHLGILGGDTTELEIDNETGKILNWKPISKEELDDYLSDFDNDVSNG